MNTILVNLKHVQHWSSVFIDFFDLAHLHSLHLNTNKNTRTNAYKNIHKNTHGHTHKTHTEIQIKIGKETQKYT